jgi:hypothetical protein
VAVSRAEKHLATFALVAEHGDEGCAMTENPYAKYVRGRDLVAVLAETPERIAGLAARWGDGAFERTYAPGKWTARQILIHLAQGEMVFSTRIRFALAEPGYVVQPFDQDPWIALETQPTGEEALQAYLGLRRFNLPLWRALTPEQRSTRFLHPEQGEIDVNWLLTLIAGHELNHLPQLEAIR